LWFLPERHLAHSVNQITNLLIVDGHMADLDEELILVN
jgi:hypothetical protein